jgi:hypothetical protein
MIRRCRISFTLGWSYHARQSLQQANRDNYPDADQSIRDQQFIQERMCCLYAGKQLDLKRGKINCRANNMWIITDEPKSNCPQYHQR